MQLTKKANRRQAYNSCQGSFLLMNRGIGQGLLRQCLCQTVDQSLRWRRLVQDYYIRNAVSMCIYLYTLIHISGGSIYVQSGRPQQWYTIVQLYTWTQSFASWMRMPPHSQGETDWKIRFYSQLHRKWIRCFRNEEMIRCHSRLGWSWLHCGPVVE